MARRTITQENVVEIAKSFSTRSAFKKFDGAAYAKGLRNGWLDVACAHMKNAYRSLTKEDAARIAEKFTTRSAFQLADNGAYKTAREKGWLAEICKHMNRGKGGGFVDSKNAYLYQIRFDLQESFTVWKVGITSCVESRLATMKIPDNISYEVTHAIFYAHGRDARMEEKRLHKEGIKKGIAYAGNPFLGNGNTELFSAPLL
jgi:hypothetical protein